MQINNPIILSLNPSTTENSIDGNTKPLSKANYSIRIANSTIDLTITITYRKGNEQSFTVSSDCIINMENVDIKKMQFSDANSYSILISQQYYAFNSEEELTAMAHLFIPRIYFLE